MSFKAIAYEGIYWTSIMELCSKFISLIASILVARILVPEDFGIVAVIGIFLSIGQTLINSGLTSSLVRDGDIDEGDYSTVFYFNIVASVIIYILIFMLAPIVAGYFQESKIVNVVRILSLNLIIQSVYSVHFTRLAKNLKYKKLAIYNLASVAVAILAGLLSAYNGYGVWSLVIQALTGELVKVLIILFSNEWKPSIIFDKNKFKRHFNFGYKIAAAGLLNTLFNEIYTFIIGKYYSVTQLGYYTRANSLSHYPASTLSTIVHKVCFPLLSSVQDDNEKLIRIQKLVIQSILFVIAPVLMITGVMAIPLFKFLFTERWLPAAPIYQILTINALLFPIHAFNLQVVGVKGRSDLFLQAEVLKKLLILITIVISYTMAGFYGMITGSVFISIVALIINMYYTSKVLPLGILEQMKSLIPILTFCVLMTLLTYVISQLTYLLQVSDLLSILLVSSVSFSLYLFIAFMLKLDALIQIIKLVR